MLRTALSCLLITSVASVAVADEQEPPPTEAPMPEPVQKLQEAYDSGKYGEALTIGPDVVQTHADNANAHYFYGLLLTQVNRADAAIEHLKKADELLPNSPEILIALSYATWDKDARAASELLKQARELAPENTMVVEAAEAFDTIQRATDGTRGEFSDGSPEKFVQDIASEIERTGDWAPVVTDHFDPQMLRDLFGQFDTEPNPKAVSDFTRGLKSGMTKSSGTYLGFLVVPGEGDAGDTAEVTVNVLLRTTQTADRVRQLERLYTDEAARKQYMDPDMLAVLESLTPAQRDEYFRDLIGWRTSNFVPVVVHVQRFQSTWKIHDLTFGGLRLSNAKAELQSLADRGVIDDPGLDGESTPYKIGKIVGYILGVLLVLAGIRFVSSRFG